MPAKEFQKRSLLRIFLSYFKPHRRLFALDLSCAFTVKVKSPPRYRTGIRSASAT